MRNLTQGLAGQGIAVIGTSLAHGDWRRDAAFLAALARADVLVINGEGTIHDGAPAARRLLDILDAPNVATARWCCERPVAEKPARMGRSFEPLRHRRPARQPKRG